MVTEYTRRQFLKTVISTGMTAAGAGLGYRIAESLSPQNTLETLVDNVYQTTHNVLAEVTGEAEHRLANSIGGLKTYLGETQKEARVLQEYWDEIGLVSPETYSDLQDAIEKAEYFVNEADYGERMSRLSDRLARASIKIDQSLQDKQPGFLKGVREGFTKLVKGEQKGSQKELDKYTQRLDLLVSIYDANRDNIVAQSDLLDETSGYFSQAQDKVVLEVQKYLGDSSVSALEKDFYRGLIDITKKDSSGRDLADYLLKTNGYFRTIGLIEGLDDLKEKINGATTEVKTLQELMNDGLELKEKVRGTTYVLPKMVSDTRNLISRFEDERKILEAQGREINYDLFPNLKAAKDALDTGIDSVFHTAKIAGAGIGGALGFSLSSGPNWVVNGSDRAFGKGQSEKYSETKKVLNQTQGRLEETREILQKREKNLSDKNQEISGLRSELEETRREIESNNNDQEWMGS